MLNNSTLRAIAFGAALGFVIAVVPSCGGSRPGTLPDGGVFAACNANTCPGCCDLAGNCNMNGSSPDACGVGGKTCLVCKLGQACAAVVVDGSTEHACRSGGTGGGTGGTGGGSATGGGTGGGTGVGGGSAAGGGTGGSAGGSSAGGGTGGGTTAACSNVTCPNGCCNQVNGKCEVGTSNTLCGAGGLACTVCNTGSGQTCQNNACVGGLCDSISCSTGCCANNVCTVPTGSQCGARGSSCISCPGANPQCDLDAGMCLGGAGGGGGTGGGAGGAGGFSGLDAGFGCFPGISPCPTCQCCDAFTDCVGAGLTCPVSGGTCNVVGALAICL
jgi:hypothetical protein